MTEKGCRPEPFYVAPSFFLCRPERSEGSLGACAPRDDKRKSAPRDDKKKGVPRDGEKESVTRLDMVGGSLPEYPLCRPEASAEGSPPGGAVPNEVRCVSLSLGRTK
jgi:hypothetical protein